MDSQRRFVKFVLLLAVVTTVLFLLEFFLEWNQAGRPGLDALSWSEAGNNAKLADILSPMARAYNNILAMLIAAVALAIPLTANMYTAKLIDMFLRDRINQFMLVFWAVGAAHVLWVLYMVGPKFAPRAALPLAVGGALLGWIMLVPYFFYIVRFLDPSNILLRLKETANRMVKQVIRGEGKVAEMREQVIQRLNEIGTITLKTIERGERSVTQEGIGALRAIVEHHGQRKPRLPAEWFQVTRDNFVGLSDDALTILRDERTWLEHRVMAHIFLAYQTALAKTQDVISSLSEASRAIALGALERGDDKALELCVKYFNNFLREAIKRKDLHAIFDLFYQYRLLASALLQRPMLLKKIGTYFRIYAEQAEAAGLIFVPQIVGFDLGWLVRHAYDNNSQAAGVLLDALDALKHSSGGAHRELLVKAKVMVGGYFVQRGLQVEVDRMLADLADVPVRTLDHVEQELLSLEDPSFWEVTDRQVMFEWVPPAQRGSVKRFIELLRGKQK